MQRTHRLILLSATTAAALVCVSATASAQQEPYPQKPVESGAIDSSKNLPPTTGQVTDTTMAPPSSTATPADTTKADSTKKGKWGEKPDTSMKKP